jgi:hypothetical protein
MQKKNLKTKMVTEFKMVAKVISLNQNLKCNFFLKIYLNFNLKKKQNGDFIQNGGNLVKVF